MKTIAAAAILAILSVPAFAADNKTGQTTDTQKPRTPIILSAKQLDGVTAGVSLTNGEPTLDESSAKVYNHSGFVALLPYIEQGN